MGRRAVSKHPSTRPAKSRPSDSGRARPAVLGRRPRIRLVVLLALAAILGGRVSLETLRTHRQRWVIRTIWEMGGYVGREYQKPEARCLVPGWYRALFGDDFMAPAVVVRLAGTDATDEDLTSIGKLPRLRMLDLRDTRISDAGLRHLRGLSHLRLLILTGTAVSDEGLAELKNMPQIEVLCLEDTSVTETGLEHLKGLANLRWLNLGEIQLTDAARGHLGNCPSLEVLVSERSDVDPEALSELQRTSPRVKVFDGTNRRPFCTCSFW